MKNKIITAIDIGTTKICVLVAGVNTRGIMEILGIGQQPSHGMKKGIIVHVAYTINALKKALRQAEKMAGVSIQDVVVGISGGHIDSFNSKSVVDITKGDVMQHDIDRVIDAAQAISIGKDREILHVLPQYFRVDNQDQVKNSLGMYGTRLEAQVHVITGNVASAQNIIKSCQEAGVNVTDIVLEQLASAEAVLGDTERELGVGILDIGGGTSDFAIYKDGRIRHSKVFAVAGNHFTSDIAIGCGISLSAAEQLKRAYGFVMKDYYAGLDVNEIEVQESFQGGAKKIETLSLFDILQPRAEEIFDLLFEEISNTRLKVLMPCGLVITGGGSLLQGIREMAQQKLYIPTRLGLPNNQMFDRQTSEINMPDGLKSPKYSTGYGLLIYAMRQKKKPFCAQSDQPLVKRVFKRMKTWMHNFI